MTGFTDDERKAEEQRRRAAPEYTERPLTECIHCGLQFPAFEATDRDNPLCPNCL
jgi:hypothetical protein